jgi:predicted Holliday junction resolvase-like endonuclease
MTSLEIFVYSSFTILVYFLKTFYERYKMTQQLIDMLAQEMDLKEEELKSLETETLQLVHTIETQKSEAQNKYNLLIHKHSSELSQLKNEIEAITAAQEKREVEFSIALNKATEDARKDALKRSRSVMRGQASEHLAPYVIEGTNPKDYRFMGNPVDYVCFDGLSNVLDGTSNSIKSVRFVDIKTGKSSLNKSQRRIRDAITSNKTTFEVVNLDEVLSDDDKAHNGDDTTCN